MRSATAAAAAAVPVRATSAGRERDAASRADLIGEIVKHVAMMNKQGLLTLLTDIESAVEQKPPMRQRRGRRGGQRHHRHVEQGATVPDEPRHRYSREQMQSLRPVQSEVPRHIPPDVLRDEYTIEYDPVVAEPLPVADSAVHSSPLSCTSSRATSPASSPSLRTSAAVSTPVAPSALAPAATPSASTLTPPKETEQLQQDVKPPRASANRRVTFATPSEDYEPNPYDDDPLGQCISSR